MRNQYESCVYYRIHEDGSFILLMLHVEDMLIVVKNKHEVDLLKSKLNNEFDMKDLGAAKRILGIEIQKDRKAEKLWVSQRRYVKKVLKRFSIQNAKPISTTLANPFKLSTTLCPTTDEKWKICPKCRMLVL